MSWATLLGVENWMARSGLSAAVLTEWLDHLWRWSTVDPETFDAWYRSAPNLVWTWQFGLPDDLIELCSERSIDPDDLRRLIVAVNHFPHGNLFGAIVWTWADDAIDEVAEVLSRYELALPSPASLPPSPRSDRHGWGSPVSEATIDRVRHLDWTVPRG